MLVDSSVQGEDAPDSDSTSKRSSVTSRGRSKIFNLQHISPELLEICDQLHPMFSVMFIDCPHTFTIDIFSRFLLRCIRELRRNNHQLKYLAENATTRNQKKVVHKTLSVELGLDEGEARATDNSAAEKEQDVDLVNVGKFSSCVTRLMCKLLLLVESYQPGDIANRRNYEVVTDMLKSFAVLGTEEEHVLLSLGGTLLALAIRSFAHYD